MRWRVIQWRIKSFRGSPAKSCVESLNILCIIVHNQEENDDVKSIRSYDDIIFQALWKQVFNSLQYNLIRLKPYIITKIRRFAPKLRSAHKIYTIWLLNFMPKAIFAAMLHFRKRASHIVGMDLYTILLNACIYKRVYIKYIIRLIRVCALYFL